MKSTLTVAGLVLLASAFLAPQAQAQKTSAGYDQNFNFASYKTFAFDTHGARNPFVNKMIIDAVERELISRGLTRVEANSDLLVVYMAATGFDLQVASVPFYHVNNAAYRGVWGDSAATMWDVTTGTLVIDLHDNKAERIVFRGTITDVLQRAPSADAAADAKIVAKPINKGIAKIFKKYPTAAK